MIKLRFMQSVFFLLVFTVCIVVTVVITSLVKEVEFKSQLPNAYEMREIKAYLTTVKINETKKMHQYIFIVEDEKPNKKKK